MIGFGGRAAMMTTIGDFGIAIAIMTGITIVTGIATETGIAIGIVIATA
jgi:hypothetical protein